MKSSTRTSRDSFELDAWLGFDSREGRLLAGEITKTGEVLPGSTITIASRPQRRFRGGRLCVHRPIASAFLIHAFRVGSQEMLVAPGPIPADAFVTPLDAIACMDEMLARNKIVEIKVGKTAAELIGMPWELPACEVGMELLLVVENIGNVPLRFIAGLLGKLLEY